MSMVTKIRAWLAIPEQERDYIKGMELYQEFGDNPRLKTLVFTRANNFPGNKKSLAHELAKLVKNIAPNAKKIAPSTKKIAKSDTIVPKSAKTDRETKRIEIPQQSLRKEFPKLNFADLTDELKILVVNKGILLNAAKEAKKKLPEATSDKERMRLNKIVVDSMLENQQIWDELNHFQSHKKVLGKHPMFSQAKELKRLKAMNNKQLFKLKQNIPTYISKAKTAIKENPKDEKLLQRKRAILDKYEWMIKEIDRLLDM